MLREALEYFRLAVRSASRLGPDFDKQAANNLVREVSILSDVPAGDENLETRVRVKHTALPWVAFFDRRLGTRVRESLHVEYVVDRDNDGLALLLGFGGLVSTDAKQQLLADMRTDENVFARRSSEAVPIASSTPLTRLRTYVGHSVTSQSYIGELPNEAALRADLVEAMSSLRRAAVSQRWRTELLKLQHLALGPAGESKAIAPKEEFEDALRLDPPRRYSVYFCSNRTPVIVNGRCINLAREHDSSGPHYGRCDVAIPKTYVTGPINESWLSRLFASEEKRFHVESLLLLQAQRFFDEVRAQLSELEGQDKRVLLYIHGFNTDFFEAIARAAQLGFDLKYPGITAAFSWAQSTGLSKKSYLADWTNIQVATPVLVKFISDISAQCDQVSVDVIAHSMGNRALLECIAALAHSSKVKLGHIVLAAPDVQAVLFGGLAASMKAVTKTRTLYVSERDRALRQAERLDSHIRAGRCPPITIVTDTDTVKIPLSDWFTFGHSYFAEGHAVITDMHQLLHHGSPPSKRSLLTPQAEKGQNYWLLRVAT